MLVTDHLVPCPLVELGFAADTGPATVRSGDDLVDQLYITGILLVPVDDLPHRPVFTVGAIAVIMPRDQPVEGP